MINRNNLISKSYTYIVLLFFCIFLFMIFNTEQSKKTTNFGYNQQEIFDAINEASKSVVGISVINKELDDKLQWQLKDGIFKPYINESNPIKSLGSGLIFSNDGYIITNTHVVENAAEIFVTLPGGEKFLAEIIGYDTLTDLALLKIEAINLPAADLGDSNILMVGEWVIALGNPLGLFDLSYQCTATSGIISGLNIDFGIQKHEYIYRDMIQTDAAINHGNSGGPLINMQGEVIGINTFIMTGVKTNQGSIGIGFSIPINHVRDVIHDLFVNGKVEREYNLGFKVKPMNVNVQKYLDTPFSNGAVVIDVENKSSSMAAGLQIGDVILKIDDTSINSYQDIINVNRLNLRKAGDYILLDIWRVDTTFQIPVELKNYNEMLY